MEDNYVIIMGENGPEVWELEEFFNASLEHMEENDDEV